MADDDARRFPAVDSLRGLAALSVVLHHCLIAFPDPYAAYFPGFHLDFAKQASHDLYHALLYLLSYTPLHLLWGGNEAVLLFYLLSGFVLALPYGTGTAPSGWAFVVKRFMRLYPPYLAAILLTFGLCAILGGSRIPGMSIWFDTLWQHPVTWQAVVEHLMMWGELYRFNSVIWSLVPEMHISLVFPALMLLIGRRFALLALPLSLVVATHWFSEGVWTQVQPYGRLGPPVLYVATSLRFLPYFAVGALMARYRPRLAAGLDRLSGTGRGALALLGLYCLNIRWEMPFVFDRTDYVTGIGAAILVALVVHRPPAWLKWQPLLWLGQRSYSLYLIHEAILLGLIFALHARVPTMLLASMAPAVAIVAAAGLFRLVEAPAIGWSRSLARRIDRRRPIPADS